MDYQIRIVEGYPEAEIPELNRIFKLDFEFLEIGLKNRDKILCCFAYIGTEMVGYKIGFRERKWYFESWIGGVVPEHRRKGIAKALMEVQHQWCIDAEFKIVSTTTAGDNAPMLITNLKSGFEICGTLYDRHMHLKVMLQKILVSDKQKQ